MAALSTMPFIGDTTGYDMFSLDPTQFHLANVTSTTIINNSPTYVRVEAPETIVDFGGQTRPAPRYGLRDKGADEL